MAKTENLEVELLKAKLENLESKIVKPKNSEEEFLERQRKYDEKKAEREALQQQIEKRRMEIMMMPELAGKARMDEVILLEAWERRAKQIKDKNPNFAIQLENEFKRKVRDIQKDTFR